MARRKYFEEEALPEKLNLGVWITISKYAFRHFPLLLLSLLGTLFVTFYDASFIPVMNAGAIAAAENIAVAGFSSIEEVIVPVTFIFHIHVDFTFTGFIILMAVMIVLRSVFIMITSYFTHMISMRIMVDLRRDTFRKIQELSFSYFDRNSSGWLIARMQNDTSSIGDVLSWSFNQVLWAVFQLVFSLVTMFSIHWLYSLVVLASLPLVAIITPIFEKAILKAHRAARGAYSRYVGYLAESIDGAKTIKTLAIEEKAYADAEEIAEDVRLKRFKAGRMNAFFHPALELISHIMIAVVILLGFTWLGDPQLGIDLATMVLFIGFVSSIYDPLLSIAEVLTEFMGAQAGAEKVQQLLQEDIEIMDSEEIIAKYGTPLEPKKENYKTFEGDIVFDNVSFHYGKGPEVIHPLNLHIEKGSSVAIVGETGSGKTTLVNLLCRFYQPTGGRILIDGEDYLNCSIGNLHQEIGYVQQNPFVFTGTYFENIAYGVDNATLDDVQKAAKIVGIDEFIESTPNGYDTFLEEGGNRLSQGQKQLISFARAILKNPPILIFDEATSSIDTITEADIQGKMDLLLSGRTSILIAHRLSTIVHCSRILMMVGGRIVEEGTHAELLAKRGAYYDLYMAQFKELSIGEQELNYSKATE